MSLQVVQYDDRTRNDQQCVRRAYAPGRWGREVLHEPRYIVCEVSNHPVPEPVELLAFHGLHARQQSLQIIERSCRLTVAVPSQLGIPVLHLAIGETPRRAWVRSQKGVAGPGFSTGGRRFQEEGEGAGPELCVCGDGGVAVEQDVAPYGDESAALARLPGKELESAQSCGKRLAGTNGVQRLLRKWFGWIGMDE